MICSEFVYRCYDEAEPKAPYHLDIAWAAAYRPAAAMAGAGIDPRSLLARIRQHSGVLGVFNDVKSALAARAAAAPAAAAAGPSLEALAKEYLAELDDAAVPEEELAVGEVVDSVRNLALQIRECDLFGARQKRLSWGLESAGASLFDQFFATVADFVTPGDLLKTSSLEDKGVVYQAPG